MRRLMIVLPSALLGLALAVGLRATVLGSMSPAIAAAGLGATQLPTRLSDAEFWRMINAFSEPGGEFRSDNLVSNELTFQHVIPELVRTTGTGGVYLGVGPDQNFTYLVAMKPRLAFIIDIRRGNLLQHLMYKAMIELAPTRADFLSLLFARPRPDSIVNDASVAVLFQRFDSVAPDSGRYIANLRAVRERLTKTHGFDLTSEDLAGIEYIHSAFFESGPELTYSFGRGNRSGYGWRGMPTYEELMIQTDAEGVARGYLASEENYQLLREMENANLIVPLVGDFAGDKAVRAVGEYLKQRGASLSAFYTSNVEQYLFQSEDAWRRFYTNVATLPVDGRSTFVRAVFNYGNYGAYRDPASPRGPRSVTMLSPITGHLTAFGEDRIQSYWDVISISRSPVPEPRE
jgi:hypothetical protein